MTPEETILNALIEAGAMVADYTAGGILTVPIHAEIVRPTEAGALPFLYWYEADAEDQHHIHARAFDAIEVVHNRDLDVQLQGRRVLYVAPFTEWPEESTDDLNERLAIARARLNDPDIRELFDSSVAENRPRQVPALLPPLGAIAACLMALLMLGGCTAPVDQFAAAEHRNAVQMQERRNAYEAARQTAVEGYVAENPSLPQEIKGAILRHHIIIGMSEADVIASFGDPPVSSTRAVSALGVCDVWFYGRNYSVCFVDGRVVSWQQES